ncbi:response regulator transcription factor [Granulosicoccaceae sp. 1_MG-2023]|nr:response regulator transcription factor [Granulosicoccaceae sp. 1_MG-2023]
MSANMSVAVAQSALVVAAQALVGAGFGAMLRECDTACEVDAACDADSALALARLHRPALLVCEYDLPGVSGGEVARKLLKENPSLPVLMVIDTRLSYLIRQLIASGVRGFITRQSSAGEFRDALAAVRRGERYMAPALATSMAFRDENHGSSPFHALSGREMEIVRLILSGRRNQEIAQVLYISDKTVSTYRARALAKLGVRSTAELTMAAMRDGVISA